MAKPPDPIFVFRGSTSPITAVKFIHGTRNHGNMLISGNQGGQLHIWDLKTKRIVRTIDAHHNKSVLWLGESSNGELLSQGRDGNINIWSDDRPKDHIPSTTLAGAPDYRLGDHLPSTTLGFAGSCITSCNNAEVIVTPSDVTGVMDIFDLKSLNKIGCLQFTESGTQHKHGMCMTIAGASQSPDKPAVVVGYEDGSVGLWDISTRKCVYIQKFHPESVMCVGYSGTHNLGVSGSVDSQLVTWRVDDAGHLKLLRELDLPNEGLNSVTFRGDEKLFTVAGWDIQTRVFSSKSLKPLAVLGGHKEAVQCLAFSNDGLLVTGSKDMTVALWDIYR